MSTAHRTSRPVHAVPAAPRATRLADQAIAATPPITSGETMPAASHASGSAPTIATATILYGASLTARTPHTAAKYRTALDRFLAYLRDSGADVEQLLTVALPATVVEDYYVWQLGQLRAAPRARYRRGVERDRAHRRTAAGYVAGIRAFLRYLDRRGWLGPGVSYEQIKDSARSAVGRLPYPTPQVPDTVARLITYVESLPLPPHTAAASIARLVLLRDKAILTTLYATALRRAELASLSRHDVQDGQATEAVVTGKGAKPRVVFFDDAARAAIRAYLVERGDSYAPLFIRHDKGRGPSGPGGERWRIDPQTVAATVEKYAALAGVPATTHHLRHLRARVLLHADLPLEALQDVLGHASPDTTKRIYAPLAHQKLRQLVQAADVPAVEVARRVGDAGGERPLHD